MTKDYKTERRKARDAILEATLPHMVFDGWTRESLAAGAIDAGFEAADAERFFTGGMRDVAEHFSDWTDRAMMTRLRKKNMDELKIRERIATAVRTRIEIFASYREAIRGLVGFLGLPPNAAVGVKATYNAVDAMWRAAGDRSADFSFYTKRATLAAVYSSTLLFWLADKSENFEETWGFLDRRIENVMQIPKIRIKLEKTLRNVPNPFCGIREGLSRVAERVRRPAP